MRPTAAKATPDPYCSRQYSRACVLQLRVPAEDQEESTALLSPTVPQLETALVVQLPHVAAAVVPLPQVRASVLPVASVPV